MANKGVFITLEGIEGAGKSTVFAGLRDHLVSGGRDAVLAREPGGTPLGERIRELALGGEQGDVGAEAELLLMFAARAQLLRDVIRPALAAGRIVLCDRFVDASHAYQGGGRGQPATRIADLESWVVGATLPDLTLLLDVPVATGKARADQRGAADRIEQEAADFFERVRQAYLDRARANSARFHIIDASCPPAAVLADAIAAVDACLEGRA